MDGGGETHQQEAAAPGAGAAGDQTPADSGPSQPGQTAGHVRDVQQLHTGPRDVGPRVLATPPLPEECKLIIPGTISNG